MNPLSCNCCETERFANQTLMAGALNFSCNGSTALPCYGPMKTFASTALCRRSTSRLPLTCTRHKKKTTNKRDRLYFHLPRLPVPTGRETLARIHYDETRLGSRLKALRYVKQRLKALDHNLLEGFPPRVLPAKFRSGIKIKTRKSLSRNCFQYSQVKNCTRGNSICWTKARHSEESVRSSKVDGSGNRTPAAL